MKHKWLIGPILLLSAALGTLGCRTTVLGQPVSARIGTRIPSRIVDTGGGETVQFDEFHPEGDTLLIVIRSSY